MVSVDEFRSLIHSSMLFKFTRDVRLDNRDGDTGFYLYGGECRGGRDDLAMKAASQELRAAVQYLEDIPQGFSVPMQCLVDFQGFRIVGVLDSPM